MEDSTKLGTTMVPQAHATDSPYLSCCGEADAFEADSFEVADNQYVAIITNGKGIIPNGTRIPVPNQKPKWDNGNPTGHSIILSARAAKSLLLRAAGRRFDRCASDIAFDKWLKNGGITMFSKKRLRGSTRLFLLAMACGAAMVDSAVARTAYDGDWSVLISTHSGACGPSYRYGVQISDGAVISDGGQVTMRGQVTPKGNVRVLVQSGGQWANGSGRLTKSRGGGVWNGQGASGACAGTWVAERR